MHPTDRFDANNLISSRRSARNFSSCFLYSAAWETAVQCRATAGKSGRVAMDRLLGYMSERREMIRYGEFLARGWQIGSGPVEAQCKTTTARVKGSGKGWDGPNAEAIMTLACLENSRLWQNYWLNA